MGRHVSIMNHEPRLGLAFLVALLVVVDTRKKSVTYLLRV